MTSSLLHLLLLEMLHTNKKHLVEERSVISSSSSGSRSSRERGF